MSKQQNYQFQPNGQQVATKKRQVYDKKFVGGAASSSMSIDASSMAADVLKNIGFQQHQQDAKKMVSTKQRKSVNEVPQGTGPNSNSLQSQYLQMQQMRQQQIQGRKLLSATNSVHEIDGSALIQGGYLVDFQSNLEAQGQSLKPQMSQLSVAAQQQQQHIAQQQKSLFGGKLIKSHAKYFSQQNSPVYKQNKYSPSPTPSSSNGMRMTAVPGNQSIQHEAAINGQGMSTNGPRMKQFSQKHGSNDYKQSISQTGHKSQQTQYNPDERQSQYQQQLRMSHAPMDVKQAMAMKRLSNKSQQVQYASGSIVDLHAIQSHQQAQGQPVRLKQQQQMNNMIGYNKYAPKGSKNSLVQGPQNAKQVNQTIATTHSNANNNTLMNATLNSQLVVEAGATQMPQRIQNKMYYDENYLNQSLSQMSQISIHPNEHDQSSMFAHQQMNQRSVSKSPPIYQQAQSQQVKFRQQAVKYESKAMFDNFMENQHKQQVAIKQQLARKSHGQLDDSSKIQDLHHYQLYDVEKEEFLRAAESQRTRLNRDAVNKSQIINPSQINAATTSSKILLDNASMTGSQGHGVINRSQTPISFLVNKSPSKSSLGQVVPISTQQQTSHLYQQMNKPSGPQYVLKSDKKEPPAKAIPASVLNVAKVKMLNEKKKSLVVDQQQQSSYFEIDRSQHAKSTLQNANGNQRKTMMGKSQSASSSRANIMAAGPSQKKQQQQLATNVQSFYHSNVNFNQKMVKKHGASQSSISGLNVQNMVPGRMAYDEKHNQSTMSGNAKQQAASKQGMMPVRNKMKTSSQSQLINNKHLVPAAGKGSALDQYGDVPAKYKGASASNYGTIAQAAQSNNIQNTRSHSSIIAKQNQTAIDRAKQQKGQYSNGQGSARMKKASAHSSKVSMASHQNRFDKSSSQPNFMQDGFYHQQSLDLLMTAASQHQKQQSLAEADVGPRIDKHRYSMAVPSGQQSVAPAEHQRLKSSGNPQSQQMQRLNYAARASPNQMMRPDREAAYSAQQQHHAPMSESRKEPAASLRKKSTNQQSMQMGKLYQNPHELVGPPVPSSLALTHARKGSQVQIRSTNASQSSAMPSQAHLPGPAEQTSQMLKDVVTSKTGIILRPYQVGKGGALTTSANTAHNSRRGSPRQIPGQKPSSLHRAGRSSMERRIDQRKDSTEVPSQGSQQMPPAAMLDGGTGSISLHQGAISSQQQVQHSQKSQSISKHTSGAKIRESSHSMMQKMTAAKKMADDEFEQSVAQAKALVSTPLVSDMNDVEYTGPLITEEDESEIRAVASDINERAFYGKVLRTKQLVSVDGGQHLDEKKLRRLSPRSQEIAKVMQAVSKALFEKGEPPVTTLDFYRIGKMLGRGAFGKVNLAMHKLVRKLVALKSLNKETLTDEVHKQKLMKEVNLLLKLRHDHIVKIYETIETDKHIIIVMELCAGGDLLNYVRKRRRLKEPLAKKIFKQIIDGLRYIHSKNVAHRDIKLDNILLDGKGQVKIADFGVSKQVQPGAKMKEQCGTPAYIAPEILRNKTGYTSKCDLWSAGVVLFAMLYGTVPFKAGSMDELHSLILRGVYSLKDDISQEARDMLRGLLDINPHKRLSYEQIAVHPWLADLDMSLQLFNDSEREMIRKEYTYNDPSRFNRNENEEPIDCFTEHHIDSVYNTMKNVSEKSIILAPFNSTQSEDFEVMKKRIKPLIAEKNLVLRLNRLCREVDRQYEFNNNGQLDNGVYHKQVNNTEGDKADAKKSKDKKEKKTKDGKEGEASSDEDDELKFQVMQCSRSAGRDFPTEQSMDEGAGYGSKRMIAANGLMADMNEQERKLIESTFGTNVEVEFDEGKIEKMCNFGYPEDFVHKSLHEGIPNYVSAGYYLLQMDQNYC